jgi:hypothetical protein
VIVYHVLTTGEEYHDLGADSYRERERDARERRHVRELEKLGYRVHLESPAA